MSERLESLRAWAKGIYTVEAGVELLARTVPKLLNGPWVKQTEDGWWFDAASVDENSGYLSGGERRVLRLAASLVSNEYLVPLSDVVSGLDREVTAVMLAAMAHAAGAHESGREPVIEVTDEGARVTGYRDLPVLFPWPEETPAP